MASRMKNISLKYNVIAENLKRAPKPEHINFRGKTKKDPMEIYRDGIGSRLPEAYFKWNRIGFEPSAVHWDDKGVEWEKDPITGDRKRVNRVPIQAYYPPEARVGLWGGEGWVKGYRKSKGDRGVRLNKTWKTYVATRKLESEILDKKFEIPATNRVMDLIDEAYGFDFYILQTPAEDLNSLVGMVVKRHLLLRLASPQDMYPDDPENRDRIYNKYKRFVIPKEEAEWVGLTPAEAFARQRGIEAAANPITPLQDIYTQELIAKYKEHKVQSDGLYTFSKEEEEKAKPFLQRFFGSGSKSKDDGTSV
ncbi:39S ribosomal protein L28, mitochondrial [Strongylocentrotus purpuratus]|uniref:39S ribosomal protein L28, mitochondrial n=1 Tax=Strongylocentrotus purpuratus TaxID=7668 RepID=A0A7M7TGM2_STRPU|nr:39S ribosomal protein L28, mitochondrial [Strongylocentrotus purpuratus]|eukprot:XP_787422.2 PREDICTED: 39S ribosomal protein L28, mitochondrial [Strongylocentrotus purpuratus]